MVNGMLHEGDQIVVCGMQGLIVTNIRALLTPHPMKELRVEACKLITLYLCWSRICNCGEPDDDIEDLEDVVMEEIARVRNHIDKSDEGVYVQALTLGSLELSPSS